VKQPVPGLPALRTDLTRTTSARWAPGGSSKFRRYDLPITPYDLRHRLAVRSRSTIGLLTPWPARMMGHSVTIHTAPTPLDHPSRQQQGGGSAAWPGAEWPESAKRQPAHPRLNSQC